MYKDIKLTSLMLISSASILVLGTVFVAMHKGYDVGNAVRFAWQRVEQKVVFTQIKPSVIASQVH